MNKLFPVICYILEFSSSPSPTNENNISLPQSSYTCPSYPLPPCLLPNPDTDTNILDTFFSSLPDS